MKIKEESQQKAIAIPEGKIDITNSQEIKERLLELIEEEFTEIVVDFTNVDNVDSSGLGKLLLLHKRLKEKGGKLKIVNVSSDYVRKMFSMIHLNKVLDIEGVE